MADVFTVGALALAAEGANAVGAVRITLFEQEMEIELVRAARFERGFVMASVAESRPMRVPYSAVRGLVRRRRALCLALDPQIGTPYTRFTLAHFTSDPREALSHAFDARQRAAVFVVTIPLVLGSLAIATASPSWASGVAGRLSVGVVVALVAWFVLRDLFQAATWGGAESNRLSESFEQALSRRLGLEPVAARPSEVPVPLLVPESDSVSRVFYVPSWIRAAVAVVGASIAVVVGIAFYRRYSKPPEASERVTIKEPATKISSVWSASSVQVAVPEKPHWPRCVCGRPSSALWNDGISKLEVLFAARPDDGSGVVVPTQDKKNRSKYDFDVSVVNNASTELPEVTVLLTFARRNAAGERVGATDRGLYFAGPLLPGRAVKWHVKAPGSEMRVEPSVSGTLDTDRVPAPADAFFELSRANQRVVRIHAAKMLAYHRDARASEVLAALGPANPGEERILGRISRAMRSVFVCDAKPVDESLEVCLVNTTVEPAKITAISVLGADDAPVARHAFEVEVPVHDGVRIRLPVKNRPAPGEFDLELAK
jgi:hypothetical protein